MTEQDPFVTVLRSVDADYVQAVLAVLRSEGIPCEHPGLNHAGLLPGISYVEIQLRVPASRQAEALELIEELGRPETSDDQTGATFRVHRTRGMLYALGGFGVGFALNLAGSFTGLFSNRGIAFLIFATAAGLGYMVGERRAADCCSRPD